MAIREFQRAGIPFAGLLVAFLSLQGLGRIHSLSAEDKSKAMRFMESPEADRRARVARIFSSVFNRDTPGCSVKVEQGGNTVFEGGFGSSRIPSPAHATGFPISADTQMLIASITKPVVAAAVLILRRRLIEKGQGDLLETKLGDIYPLFRNKAGFKDITVRMLLEHTSSLIRDPDLDTIPDSAKDEDVPRLLNAMGRKAFLRPAIGYWNQNTYVDGQLIQRPGARYSYSNAGYMLLADILTRKSGTNWKDFLQREIFDPLQMNHTSPNDNFAEDQRAGRLPHGHEFVEHTRFDEVDVFHRGVQRIYQGPGGLFSTVSDLLRFSRAIDEHRLLSGEDWKLAFTPSPQSLRHRFDEPYGLGWVVPGSNIANRNPSEVQVQYHSGRAEGFQSTLLRAKRERPACRLTIAILCNVIPNQESDFWPDTAAAQIQEVYCPASQ